MSARAEARSASRAAAPRRARVVALPGARSSGRTLVAGGAVWVALLAALLGGIVALNVAALRASLALNQVTAQTQRLRTENDVLAARVAGMAAPSRIDAFARRAGMI